MTHCNALAAVNITAMSQTVPFLSGKDYSGPYYYYWLLQVTTGYYRLLQVTTGYYMLVQVTAVYYRLLLPTKGY